jgi:hypothetical protein
MTLVSAGSRALLAEIRGDRTRSPSTSSWRVELTKLASSLPVSLPRANDRSGAPERPQDTADRGAIIGTYDDDDTLRKVTQVMQALGCRVITPIVAQPNIPGIYCV